MKSYSKQMRMVLFTAASLLGTAAAFGQAPAAQPQQQPAPAPTPGDKSAPPQAAPLTLESTPPPVSAEEDAAFKTFNDMKVDDIAKKNQAADEFLQKYPQSRYRAEVYAWLVKAYYSTGQTDKMEAAADKQLELTPNDAQTLAIAGSTLPRAMNSSTPDPQKRLAKAEQFCQRALELLPTAKNSGNLTDEQFQQVKNRIAALAYSGLGVVAFRRGKFADAIPNFEQALKVDPQPDPVNYYLLGICNEKTAHFDDAVTDFTKCSAVPSGVQATCKQDIDEAKKLGATQLSSPK
jgi:tetratricopeptide (TPR) repeat protein